MAITVDMDRLERDACIDAGTILFRITSPSFSDKNSLLTGIGAEFQEGRYHYKDQRTSYLANNVLLCMAEILYHMSRQAMAVLADQGAKKALMWKNRAKVQRELVVLEVEEIPNLVYLDSKVSRRDRPVASIAMVHPDHVYGPLQDASTYYRKDNSCHGIVYPSARHSKDLAVALFRDHTSCIRDILAKLELTLSLVEEESLIPADTKFDPYEQKISHTKGYYSIRIDDYNAHRSLLIPDLPSPEGTIDFVRCCYTRYPDEAVGV